MDDFENACLDVLEHLAQERGSETLMTLGSIQTSGTLGRDVLEDAMLHLYREKCFRLTSEQDLCTLSSYSNDIILKDTIEHVLAIRRGEPTRISQVLVLMRDAERDGEEDHYDSYERLLRAIFQRGIEAIISPEGRDKMSRLRNAARASRMPSGGNVTNNIITVNLGNGASFKGDFVVAQSIKDSFNKAAEFKTKRDDLGKQLEELTLAIAKLSEQIPQEKQQEVARDLKGFVQEVTSASPRREWYTLTAKGMIEAAKTCAAMAAPVATTVTAILKMLGG